MTTVTSPLIAKKLPGEQQECKPVANLQGVLAALCTCNTRQVCKQIGDPCLLKTQQACVHAAVMLQLCVIVSCQLLASAPQHAAGKGIEPTTVMLHVRLQLGWVLKAAKASQMLTCFEARMF